MRQDGFDFAVRVAAFRERIHVLSWARQRRVAAHLFVDHRLACVETKRRRERFHRVTQGALKISPVRVRVFPTTGEMYASSGLSLSAASLEIEYDERQAMVDALYELCSNPVCWTLFSKPVLEQHPEVSEAYLKVVKRPLDLRTVARRLRGGGLDKEKFRRRVRRVLKNCEVFNADVAQYREAARHFLGYWDDLFKFYVEWKCVVGEETWRQRHFDLGGPVMLSVAEERRILDLTGISVTGTLAENAQTLKSEHDRLFSLLCLRCSERRTRGNDLSTAWAAAVDLRYVRNWPVLFLGFENSEMAKLNLKRVPQLRRHSGQNALIEYLGTHEFQWVKFDSMKMGQTAKFKRKEGYDLAKAEADLFVQGKEDDRESEMEAGKLVLREETEEDDGDSTEDELPPPPKKRKKVPKIIIKKAELVKEEEKAGPPPPPKKQAVSQRPKEPSTKATKRDRERAARALKKEQAAPQNIDRRAPSAKKVADFVTALLRGRIVTVTNGDETALVQSARSLQQKTSSSVDGEDDQAMQGGDGGDDSSSENSRNSSDDEGGGGPPLTEREELRCRRLAKRAAESEAARSAACDAADEETDSEAEGGEDFATLQDPAMRMRALLAIKMRLEADIERLKEIEVRVDRFDARRAYATALVNEKRIERRATKLAHHIPLEPGDDRIYVDPFVRFQRAMREGEV